MTKRDITPKNNKKQAHGLWICYYNKGKIRYKGNFINGLEHGYWILYYYNGEIHHKGHCVNGSKHGYWIENWNNDTHKITFYIK